MPRCTTACWLCSLLALLTLPALASAADAVAPLSPLADELARTAGAIVQVAVLLLAGLVLQVLRAKLGVDLSSAADARMRAWAAQAGAYAEEVAAAELHGKLDGAGKLAEASAWLRKRCPQLSDDEARQLILAALPFVGAGASAPVPPPPQA